jgi:hypothetical protein
MLQIDLSVAYNMVLVYVLLYSTIQLLLLLISP